MTDLLEQLVPGVGLVAVTLLFCWLFDRGEPAPPGDVAGVEVIDDDGDPN